MPDPNPDLPRIETPIQLTDDGEREVKELGRRYPCLLAAVSALIHNRRPPTPERLFEELRAKDFPDVL